MAFKIGKKSRVQLAGVHPDLVKVVERAIQITEEDFFVCEGVRTPELQAEYVKKGVSKTLKSLHLKQKSGWGHAVDLYPVAIGKRIPWSKCPKIAEAMQQAAKDCGVRIRWGGDWNQNGRSDDEKFYDSPHFELDKRFYPV